MKRRWPRDVGLRGKRRRRSSAFSDYPVPDLSYRQAVDSQAFEATQSQNVDHGQTGARSSVPDGDNGEQDEVVPHLSQERDNGVHIFSGDDLNLCEQDQGLDAFPIAQFEEALDVSNYQVPSSGDDEEHCGADELEVLGPDMAEATSSASEIQKIRMNAGVVSSMLIAMGTERMNQRWYGTMRRFMGWGSQSPENVMKLPSISKMTKMVRPLASRRLFPLSKVVMFDVDMAKAGANRGLESGALSGRKPVRILKPSEWAKMDICSRVISSLFDKGGTEHGSEILVL